MDARLVPGIILATLVASAWLACSVNPSPVGLAGDAADLGLLDGSWVGSYQSPESGRSGEIAFSFEAERGEASGYVLMKPAKKPVPFGYMGDWGAEQRAAGDVRLTIDLVEVEGSSVQGRLNRYTDPDCGCSLCTRFEGRVEGDSIRGTFTTLHLDSGREEAGEWAVGRRSP